MLFAAAFPLPHSLMRAKRKGCADFSAPFTVPLNLQPEKTSSRRTKRAQRKPLREKNPFHLLGIGAFSLPLSELCALRVLCGEPHLTAARVASLQTVCHNEFPEFVHSPEILRSIC
jgi:hypothetical protein